MDLDIQQLLPWIEASLRDGSHQLASGYQGSTLLYEDGSSKVVIKTPHGKGLMHYLHRRMLQHEYAAYKKLVGHPNIPQCYGMIDDTYLALEYIDAKTTREQRPPQDSKFYDLMFVAIEKMHAMQVAHIDLKKKDNVMAADDGTPYIIDFGVAIIYKQGFHPLNHYLFKLGKRFDWNGWIKHKYQWRKDEISEADQQYYNRSAIEKVSRLIKLAYLRMKKRFSG